MIENHPAEAPVLGQSHNLGGNNGPTRMFLRVGGGCRLERAAGLEFPKRKYDLISIRRIEGQFGQETAFV